MWKDYSIGFIKKNRASSVSVMVAAFISALFLSLLCGLFYNFWNYEIESVVLEEGNWQEMCIRDSTKMAPSKTAKERYTSAKKSMWPGVSTMLTLHLCHWKEVTAA